MSAQVKRKSKNPKFEPIYVSLGIIIGRCRADLGISQAALGELCNFHPASIGNIENGRHRIRLHDLLCIAKALKLTIPELLQRALDEL